MDFFWRYSIKRGKNDHIFHGTCLKYIQEYYDNKRIKMGRTPVKISIVHTDNCPTQYKCRKNFYNVSMFGSHHEYDCQLVHKFAQKFRFKGSWDATGKMVKLRILNNELRNMHCKNDRGMFYFLFLFSVNCMTFF